ncbi:MAG: hypothetical protein MUO73_07395 [Thermoplasmata archaeon]|nr:hypothetical protein [Thermoplasmata archaeon]
MTILKTSIVGIIAHLKIIAFYGAEITYPFFSLFTAIGIAKVAFGVPVWIAAILMSCAVFGLGFFSFKSGIFGKDLDIKWQNTKSARELSERVKRMEEQLSTLSRK